MTDRTITVASRFRRYWVGHFEPGLPVIFLLHGTGATPDWFARETEFVEAARLAGFSCVLPEGLPIHPDKPPKFLTNPLRWNDGSTQVGDHLHTDADDVLFLDRLAVELREEGATMLFVAGFSNGAGMAFRFAAERAELVAGLAAVAGYCWSDAKPSRSVPGLYIVGDSDPLIPLPGGVVRSPWGGRSVQRPSVAETLEKWEAANGAPMQCVIIPGLGHHWPGGLGQLPTKIGGVAHREFDANTQVLQFFVAEFNSGMFSTSWPGCRGRLLGAPGCGGEWHPI
jgi:polyhydroxybutyrate depolymerase